MKRRQWASQEIELFVEWYPVEGPRRLAEELKRSEDSISSFARRCGLRTPRSSYRRHAGITKESEPRRGKYRLP